MTHILSRASLFKLRRFLAWRVLLAFDFDGTLAPIVSDRRAARMRPRTRALLEPVCRMFPCAVISGRGRADVSERLEGLPFRHVVGNHGLDPGVAKPALARSVARARTIMAAALDRQAGVEVEDKTYSFAIHYRGSADRPGARRRIEQALTALDEGFRVVPGKLVFDVIPASVSTKGGALVRLLRRTRADAAIYVGDDVTDEDVFALGVPERLISIRVGRRRLSAADYFVRDQRDLDELLLYLGRARERLPGTSALERRPERARALASRRPRA